MAEIQRIPKASVPYTDPNPQYDYFGGSPSGYNYQHFSTPPNWYPNPDEYSHGYYTSLHNFGNAGYFDPRGNQLLIEAGRMNAGNLSRALQQQGSLAAQSSGLNPTQRNSFELQNMLKGSGNYAQLLNQALMQAWQQQAQYAQQLGLQQAGLASRPGQQSSSPNFWQSAAPALGGALGGALFGPGGGAGGAAVGNWLAGLFK